MLIHKEDSASNWCFWIVVLKKTLQSPPDRNEIKPVNPKGNISLNIHWKDWCWSWSSNTLATWYEKLTYWKRPWWWKRLRSRGERGDRGWDGWMALLSKLQETVEDWGLWSATVHEDAKSQIQLSDWTTTTAELIFWENHSKVQLSWLLKATKFILSQSEG